MSFGGSEERQPASMGQPEASGAGRLFSYLGDSLQLYPTSSLFNNVYILSGV